MKFKKINKLLAALVVSSLVSAAAVKGAFINGDIHFKNGSATLNAAPASATEISNFTGVQTNPTPSTADFSGVTDGLSVTMLDLDFGGVGYAGAKVINNFWSFTDGGVDYSFDLTYITAVTWTGTALVIDGQGTTNATGYDSYAGTFQLSTSGGGESPYTVSFSSSTSVPDSGTTTALLGLSMLGLAGAARRLRK